MFLLREHHYYNGGKKEENIKNIDVFMEKKQKRNVCPYDLKGITQHGNVTSTSSSAPFRAYSMIPLLPRHDSPSPQKEKKKKKRKEKLTSYKSSHE